MKLSLLIATRVDDWEGNPIERLARTLAWTLPRLRDDEEVVVTDFGGEQPLVSVLPAEQAQHPRLTILRVTPEQARACGGAFSEPHALNHAAQHARGEWLGRIDGDTLPGDEFFAWFRDASGPAKGVFYFSNRRDMAEGQTEPAGCEPVTYPPAGPHWWRWHVGILLAERSRWHALRGYDERETGRNHMEHSFIARLNRTAPIGNIGALLGCPFYHQWHGRSGHESRPQNRLLSAEELGQLPIVANDENWGLN